MAEMRCSISLVINGGRWLQEGEALAARCTQWLDGAKATIDEARQPGAEDSPA